MNLLSSFLAWIPVQWMFLVWNSCLVRIRSILTIFVAHYTRFVFIHKLWRWANFNAKISIFHMFALKTVVSVWSTTIAFALGMALTTVFIVNLVNADSLEKYSKFEETKIKYLKFTFDLHFCSSSNIFPCTQSSCTPNTDQVLCPNIPKLNIRRNKPRYQFL